MILFLALYPQLALHRSEGSVKTAVAAAHATRRCTANSARARRRPQAIEVQERGSNEATVITLATAHLKGPHIDFAGLSPLIALLGGAASCCWSA